MKKISGIRKVIQGIMLFIVTIAALKHGLSSAGINFPWISESLFHYICPICGVTSIYQFFASSSLFVVKLKTTLGIAIGLVIISGMIFGPVICGFICPFGAIQDFTALIGKKIFKNKYNKFIPKKIHNKLKYLRYISLIAALILTSISGGIAVLEKVNPYHGYLSIFKGTISYISLGIFIAILIISLFIQRPWCKYLCPYGALLGLFNKLKVFRVIRRKSTCVSCKRCSNNCPMNIDVHEKEEVRNLECISCMECTKKMVCPKDSTISFSGKELEELN